MKPKANFSKSSRNIELRGETLHAECLNSWRVYQKSTLNLDLYLGAHRGERVWGGKNYSLFVDNARLEGTVLHATLYRANGTGHDQSVDLDDRIRNTFGHLSFMDEFPGSSGSTRRIWTPIESHPARPHESGRKTERDENEITAVNSRRAMLAQVISDCQPFQHESLGNEKNFRLVKIAPPREQQDVLECALIEVDSATCPKYAALSYT
jgi:hypothetical protein